MPDSLINDLCESALLAHDLGEQADIVLAEWRAARKSSQKRGAWSLSRKVEDYIYTCKIGSHLVSLIRAAHRFHSLAKNHLSKPDASAQNPETVNLHTSIAAAMDTYVHSGSPLDALTYESLGRFASHQIVEGLQLGSKRYPIPTSGPSKATQLLERPRDGELEMCRVLWTHIGKTLLKTIRQCGLTEEWRTCLDPDPSVYPTIIGAVLRGTRRKADGNDPWLLEDTLLPSDWDGKPFGWLGWSP